MPEAAVEYNDRPVARVNHITSCVHVFTSHIPQHTNEAIFNFMECSDLPRNRMFKDSVKWIWRSESCTSLHAVRTFVGEYTDSAVRPFVNPVKRRGDCLRRI